MRRRAGPLLAVCLCALLGFVTSQGAGGQATQVPVPQEESGEVVGLNVAPATKERTPVTDGSVQQSTDNAGSAPVANTEPGTPSAPQVNSGNDQFAGSEQSGQGDLTNVDPRMGDDPNMNADGTYKVDIVKNATVVTLKWSGDINPKGACAFDKENLCGKIPFGKQQVLRCLTMHLTRQWDGVEEVSITPGCVEEMLDYKIHHTQSINGDIQLAEGCQDDATRLCTEPERYQHGGDGGAIVACLRANHEQLQMNCKQEVFRIMREAAYDFRLDANLHAQCSKYVEKHCKQYPPGEGRVLACLHDSVFHEMEDNDCKREILRQLRESASNVQLNYQLYQACNFEMQQFCQGIQPGDQRMQTCLVESRDRPGFTPGCKESVVDMLGHMMQDAQEDTILTQECKKDLETFCGDIADKLKDSTYIDKGEILTCLSKNRESLGKPCLGEVTRLLAEQYRNIKFNPKLQQACSADIKEHCLEEVHDEGRTINCLVENRDNGLSQTCGQLLFQQRVVMNENIQFNRVLGKACGKDRQEFCKDVVPGEGRVIRCLLESFEDEGMSSTCKEALSAVARDRAEDYRLDPQLKKACQEDAQNLCNSVCEQDDSIQTCDGKIIACLEYYSVDEGQQIPLGNSKEDLVNPNSHVSEECQRELSFRARMEAADYRNNEVLSDACAADASKFCTGDNVKNRITPGNGRVFECLFSHLEELDEECRESEIKFKIVQSESITRLPFIMKVCQMEMAFFCNDVTPDQGAVLTCLEASLEKTPAEFGPDCREAMAKRATTISKDFRFDKGLFKHCKKVAKSEQYNCPKTSPKNLTNGKVFTCLVNHYDDMLKKDSEAKCAMEMGRVIRRLIYHYTKNSPITKVCDQDFQVVCQENIDKQPGKNGKYSRCLRLYFKEHDSMPSPECQKLVEIGYGKPSDEHNIDKKYIKEGFEKSTTQTKQISENLKSLGELVKKVQNKQTEQSSASKKAASDQNTFAAVVAVLGIMVVAVIVVGVWAIRKYLKQGYVVLKSGDV